MTNDLRNKRIIYKFTNKNQVVFSIKNNAESGDYAQQALPHETEPSLGKYLKAKNPIN